MTTNQKKGKYSRGQYDLKVKPSRDWFQFLHLIGKESGESALSQLQSAVKQNQWNRSLLTTLDWKFLWTNFLKGVDEKHWKGLREEILSHFKRHWEQSAFQTSVV